MLSMKQDNHVSEEGSYCLMKSIAELLVILVILYHTLNATKQILLHNVWRNCFSPSPQFPTLYFERKQCFLIEHIQILGGKY